MLLSSPHGNDYKPPKWQRHQSLLRRALIRAAVTVLGVAETRFVKGKSEPRSLALSSSHQPRTRLTISRSPKQEVCSHPKTHTHPPQLHSQRTARILTPRFHSAMTSTPPSSVPAPSTSTPALPPLNHPIPPRPRRCRRARQPHSISQRVRAHRGARTCNEDA